MSQRALVLILPPYLCPPFQTWAPTQLGRKRKAIVSAGGCKHRAKSVVFWTKKSDSGMGNDWALKVSTWLGLQFVIGRLCFLELFYNDWFLLVWDLMELNGEKD